MYCCGCHYEERFLRRSNPEWLNNVRLSGLLRCARNDGNSWKNSASRLIDLPHRITGILYWEQELDIEKYTARRHVVRLSSLANFNHVSPTVSPVFNYSSH